MATSQTTNYKLNLWQPTDKFVREEFNENTNKLDAAIKAVDTKAAAKADASALTAEINARKTAVTNEASARAAADTAEANARTAAVQDLENRKAYFQLLKTVNITNKTGVFSVDVSDIDWGAWQYVFMDVDVTDGYGDYCLLPNKENNNNSSSRCANTSVPDSIAGVMHIQPNNGFRVKFYTCKAPNRKIRTGYWFYEGESGVFYQDLNTLFFTKYNTSLSCEINSGTIKFWGLA